MNFEFTKEQMDIKMAAREFAEGEFPDIARECDRKEEFPMEVWKKACELGFVGVFIKQRYGGAGLGFFESSLIMEEFWRVDPGCGNILLTSFGTELIQGYGREEQKNKYLSLIPSGEAIMGVAITEPDAGSDIFSVSTTAVTHGDEYVINGSKMFITNGTIADYLVVFFLKNPEEKSRYKRYSMIFVETDRPGFEASKLRGKMGVRASDTAEIALKDIRVPKKNLIGEQEGQGFPQVMELFNINRLFAAAQGTGVGQGALEKAVKYVKQRRAFGQAIADFQAVQFKLAEMATKIEAARVLTYQACCLLDAGKRDPKLIAMAKWFAGEVGVRVTDDALQLHGGYGYFADYDIERFYRDAKVVEIYEATKEIEKITIAKEVLGRR
jgi:acyl-CoA dehydrogenase